MSCLNVQFDILSGSRKHLLWKTHNPTCLCLPKTSLILLTMQLMIFFHGKQRQSANCAIALNLTPLFVQTIHIEYTPSTWLVCWKTVRDKVSLKTIAYILSKLASKEKPGTYLLAPLKRGNVGMSELAHCPKLLIQGQRIGNAGLGLLQKLCGQSTMSALSKSEESWFTWVSGGNKTIHLISRGLGSLWLVLNVV